MKKEILAGFKEIAAEMGYSPDEVYFDGEKLVLPPMIAEKVKMYFAGIDREK